MGNVELQVSKEVCDKSVLRKQRFVDTGPLDAFRRVVPRH